MADNTTTSEDAAAVTLARRVLDLPIGDNDARASTIREYLGALLASVWEQREGFSGKRPFGNSGWAYELYVPLIHAGFVQGRLDEDGFVEEVDNRAADALISDAIAALTGGAR